MLFTVDIEDIRQNRTVAAMTDLIIPGSLKVTRAGVAWEIWGNEWEASRYTSHPQAYRVTVTRLGEQRYYRLTAPNVIGNRIQFNAASLSACLSDLEYTRLWSQTGIAAWNEATKDDMTALSPALYQHDMQKRLYATLVENGYYNTNLDGFAWFIEKNKLQSDGLLGVALDYDLNIPFGFYFEVLGISHTRPWAISATAFSAPPLGAVYPGSMCARFATPVDIIMIRLINKGAAFNAVGVITGTQYVKLTAVRVVSTLANTTNTTTTAALVAGSNVLIPVGSTANMVIGQDVYLGTAAGSDALENTERTQVLSIVSATQFRANLAKAHVTNVTVRTLRVTERTIIADLIAKHQAVNPGWLQTAIGKVQDSGEDKTDAVYVKTLPIDVLRQLATRYSYAFGVDQQGFVYFYPAALYARRWMVDAAGVQLNRPMIGQAKQLYTSVQAEYADSDGRQQVTTVATNTGAALQTGLVRSRTITVATTSATEAATARDLALADTSAWPIEAALACEYVMTEQGAISVADAVAENDTITIRNISAAWGDQNVREIPVYEVEITAETGQITIVPATPISRLDRYLARIK